MAQKKTKGKIVEKRNEVIESLEKFGTQVYNQIESGAFFEWGAGMNCQRH